VGHPELPPERSGWQVLVDLAAVRDVGHVTDQVQHAHGPLGGAQAEHDLVAGALAERLDGHLARVQEVRHGLRHGGEEEVTRARIDVVEVPAAGREQPDLRVLPEDPRDAAATLDVRGTGGPELWQPKPRRRKPELLELREGLPVHLTPGTQRTSASTLSSAPFTRSRSFSYFTSIVRVDSTSAGSSCSAFRMTSDRAQSIDSETDGGLRSSMARIF